MALKKSNLLTQYRKRKDKVIDLLKENEIIFFKKIYEKAVYKIATTQLEIINNKRISLNDSRIKEYLKTYPFIENIKNIYLSKIDEIYKRDLCVKEIIIFLTETYNNEQKKELKKGQYQKRKNDISINLYSILYEFEVLKQSKKRIENIKKSNFIDFFENEDLFNKTIKLLKENNIISKNNRFNSDKIDHLLILICKLIDNKAIPNTDRKIKKIAQSSSIFFNIKFDETGLNKMINDYKNGSLSNQQIMIFNSYNFLD